MSGSKSVQGAIWSEQMCPKGMLCLQGFVKITVHNFRAVHHRFERLCYQ
jgi:hypothetical protein